MYLFVTLQGQRGFLTRCYFRVNKHGYDIYQKEDSYIDAEQTGLMKMLFPYRMSATQ